MPPAAGSLFWLGCASGITVMAGTAYRHISPAWLKWLLAATALVLLARYAALACLSLTSVPEHVGVLRPLWLAAPISLLLPSAAAADLLIRHPAMTPQKLMRLLSPALIGYGLIIVCAPARLVPTLAAGWLVRLTGLWQALFLALQLSVSLGFVGVCVLLIRKIPLRPIQHGLALLALSQLLQGVDAIRVAVHVGSSALSIQTEIASLLAIWFACETGARLQQTG